MCQSTGTPRGAAHAPSTCILKPLVWIKSGAAAASARRSRMVYSATEGVLNEAASERAEQAGLAASAGVAQPRERARIRQCMGLDPEPTRLVEKGAVGTGNKFQRDARARPHAGSP